MSCVNLQFKTRPATAYSPRGETAIIIAGRETHSANKSETVGITGGKGRRMLQIERVITGGRGAPFWEPEGSLVLTAGWEGRPSRLEEENKRSKETGGILGANKSRSSDRKKKEREKGGTWNRNPY